jgi:hypothetical protein
MFSRGSGQNLPGQEAGVVTAQTAIGSARDYAISLERIERSKGATVDQARRRIAQKIRTGFGAVDNIIRERVKRVDERVRDRLCAVLVRELEAEIGRLEHELAMVRRSNSRLGAEHVREIQTHIAAAKALLTVRAARPAA